MLKISRGSQLFLVLGIFLIIFGALFVIQKGQLEAQENLKKDLTLAQTTLAKLTTTAAEWQAKIRATEAELQAAEALFPELEQSLELTSSLFRLATQNQLKIIGSSTTTTRKKIDKIDYEVISLELKLQGQIADILSFIVKLKTELPTGEITSVSIDKTQKEGELDTGKIGLHIYTKRKS